MDTFLRRLSFLVVLLVLAGCGRGRSAALQGQPYPVTLAQGVLIAPTATTSRSTKGRSSGGSFFSGSGNVSCGSGKDALAGIVVVIAVVVVVAVVVLVVDAAISESDPITERYYLTLSGEGVPLEVVAISDNNQLYLDKRQYDALARGAYNRAVIRPAVWEGTRGAPTQQVQVTLTQGRVLIALLDVPPPPPPDAGGHVNP